MTQSGDFASIGQAGPRTVSVGTSGTATFTVGTADDDTDEPDGGVTAAVTAGTGYSPHAQDAEASVAVADNDVPVVSVSGGDAVTEGGAATFTLTATPAPSAAITVNVGVTQSGDFASSGQTGSRTVSVGTTGTATFTVGTADDDTDEPDGGVTAAVTAGTGYSPHAQDAEASVAVADNDVPVVSVSGGDAVTEGGAATFTLTATPAPSAAITVNVDVTQSGDFASIGQTGSRTVSVGTTGTATFTVGTADDDTDEPDGGVTAAVTAGTGYSPHAQDAEASVAVADNDVPVVSVSGGDAVTEGGAATFTLTATPAPSAAITVNVDVTQSGDFASIGQTGSRTVSVGTTGTATFTVGTVDDETDEPDGDVTATVNTGTDYALHAQDFAASVTVADNDVPAAAREHLFPLFADGDGFRGRLFLTDVSAADNRCALELRGVGLDANRFERHAALTASAAGARIDFGAAGPDIALATTGAGGLAVGYAKLSCERPALARMLLVLEDGGVPMALTDLESTQGVREFRFPVLPRVGRLGLVFANDNALDASCAVELTTASGARAGGNLAVPARSAAVRFLDELAPLPDDAEDGSVSVTCDRAVAPLGVALHGGDFAALAAFVPAPAPAAPEDGDDPRTHRVLPLVRDGGGFRSHLAVANLSDTANSCKLRLHMPGAPTARFALPGGAATEGFDTIALTLAGGGQAVLSSRDRNLPAFGHAVLDCDAPADLRNLLTARADDGSAGVAAVSPATPTKEIRFPVAPGLARLALVLSNAGEADAFCEAALSLPGREEAAGPSIRVAGGSTAIRFLADLFGPPDDFEGGAVTLRCDREIAAVALPAAAGAAFTAQAP